MSRVSPEELKAATRRLVKRCGGQESCVLIDGIGTKRHQGFSDAGSMAEPHAETFLRLDRVALLEADCGDPVITATLARATGHVLVRLPDAAAMGAGLGRVTAEALKECSDMFGKLAVFLDDGTLSAVEGAQFDLECDEAIAAVLALKAQARAAVGKGGK